MGRCGSFDFAMLFLDDLIAWCGYAFASFILEAELAIALGKKVYLRL